MPTPRPKRAYKKLQKLLRTGYDVWAMDEVYFQQHGYPVHHTAKYHHAAIHKEWRIAKEPGFRLLFLPLYSPDLNPVEKVWKLVRRLRL